MARNRELALGRGYHRWVEQPFESEETVREWLAETANELVVASRGFCKREVRLIYLYLYM